MIQELKKFVGEQSSTGVEKSGHRIKGNVRNFYSEKLASLALEIEEAGRSVKFEGLMAKVDELEVGLKDLEMDLRESLLKLSSDSN
ncbi:MAG: hypothetical protein AAF202_09385 [Pseudomonadota bacterium]